jgi:cytoskeleton protein RodZ
VHPADDSSELAPGLRLAAERERQGLSRADVAQRLHMSVSQVEALETGDYGRLPRGTFLRGFVRNYAKALGFDPNVILRALNETAPRDPRPGIVVASQNIRFDPIGDRLSNPYVKAAGLATVALSVGFAAMYWWLFIRPAPPAGAAMKKTVVSESRKVEPLPAPVEAPRMDPPRVEAAKAEVAKPEAAKPEVARPEVAKPEAARPEVAKPAPAKPAKPEPPAFANPAVLPASAAASQNIDAGPVIAAGGSVIRLKFRGNAWVEIRDGRGKVLLSRNNQAGSEAEVVGKGPFNVVVGNAPEVTMYFNDREFDLEPHTRVAVARFTVQ